MHLRRSLHFSGVIGFLAFPKMGRARRHVAAVSLAGDVHLRGEHGTIGDENHDQQKKYRFFHEFWELFYQILAVKQFQQFVQ